MNFRCKPYLIAGVVAACGAPPTTSSPVASVPSTPANSAAPASPPPAPAAASAAPTASEKPQEPTVAKLSAEAVPLPGATAPVSLDFLFYEPKPSRVWVPAGGSGSVDVFDVAKRAFTRIEGFKTVEREAHGKKRVFGPSAGAVGDGFAYIGNRATQEICAVDLKTLKKGACLKLPSPTDCVEYVPSKHEVWVTTPSTHSLIVLGASPKGTLSQKAVIKVEGEPEGYALDESHGVFLTNLEDKGTTLTIDLTTHAVRDTWNAACSSDGPRGIAVDSARSLVFVACTDHVQALDMAHAGGTLGKLETGAGLDNIDYVPATGMLYAAAGKASRLTVAHISDRGEFTIVASGDTAEGARNAVADAAGNVYVADPQGAHLLVVSESKPDAK
jgi:DNA-binding beta-propeller fold protein YncE